MTEAVSEGFELLQDFVSLDSTTTTTMKSIFAFMFDECMLFYYLSIH
jgi:hypothetical protein